MNVHRPYRRFIAVPLLTLILVSGWSCAGNPPPGTYTPQVTQAYKADQFMQDLNALGQTARNLNATSGRLHLSDRDTQLTMTFSLAAGTGLLAYGQGATTIAAARALIGSLALPPGYLTAIQQAFDNSIRDHGANASVLIFVRDTYLAFKANVSINFGASPQLHTLLALIDAQIEALPIP